LQYLSLSHHSNPPSQVFGQRCIHGL
jgi:hypothetical protein